MTGGETDAAIREELRLVDEELAELRTTVAEMRRRAGERWDGPVDPAEHATALTNVEEQDALIEGLTARREELRQRIGLSRGTGR